MIYAAFEMLMLHYAPSFFAFDRGDDRYRVRSLEEMTGELDFVDLGLYGAKKERLVFSFTDQRRNINAFPSVVAGME